MPYMLPLPSMQAPCPPDQSSSSRRSKPQQQLMRTVSISILAMSLPVLYVSFLHVPPAAFFRDTTFWFLMSNSIIIVIAADSGMLFFGSSSSSNDGGGAGNNGLPLVVISGGAEAAAAAAVKNDDQVMQALREEQGDATMMVAENDVDHAYALVLRDEQQGQQRVSTSSGEPPECCRDIMVVTLPRSSGRQSLVQLKPSKSLAREERLQMRRRRRQSHRVPSPSHSRALVPVLHDKSVAVAVAEEEERERESEYSRLSDEELNRRVEEFITKFNREMRMQLEREQLALAAA